MVKFTALLLSLALCGCATTRGNAELTWQAMNVVDLGQTLHIANGVDCYHERNPLTRTLIGRHPSEGAVIGVMVGYSALHFGVSKFLEHQTKTTGRQFWKVMEGAWHVVSLTTKANTVKDNHDIGLTPFGRGCN